MKRLLLSLCLLLSFSAFSQSDTTATADSIPPKPVKKWKRSMETGLNVNQASFSGNWKGGGVNSIALGALFNGRALYETKKISFDNVLQLQYGFLKNEGQQYRKSNDKIFLESKLGYKLTSKWNVFASVNFLSQFSPGFEYRRDSNNVEEQFIISRFFAPAYLTGTMGMEYKPADYFWVRFGVGGFRKTFVTDTTIYRNVPENYGVPIGKKVRNEIAFVLVANFDKDIAKNLNLKIRFTTFSNYEDLAATDIRSDISLNAKVNKYINVSLSGIILYDQDQDYRTQYNQALALGLAYKFSEFPEKKK